MGKQVIASVPIRRIGFSYRKSLFGKMILTVGYVYRDWDTNTGQDTGRMYIKYSDASEDEANDAVLLINSKEKVSNVSTDQTCNSKSE